MIFPIGTPKLKNKIKALVKVGEFRSLFQQLALDGVPMIDDRHNNDAMLQLPIF